MLAALMGLLSFAEPALALDKVKFGTNWLADPAMGYFFQAAADWHLRPIWTRRHHHSSGPAD